MYYEDVFRELNSKKVRYLIVGGVAVVLHGVVRLTVDLDIFVDFSKKNIENFALCMKNLGYKPKLPVKIEELQDSEKRKMWIEEKGAKVFSFFHLTKHEEHLDIFIYEPIPFKDAYRKRKIVVAKDIEIPIISIDDLIKMKEIASREQDLADISALKDLMEIVKNEEERI
ncbi:MAG: hypothetical protein QME42_05555 [bacterium]|nr:hypothetical protein [bacterium]